MRSLALRRLVFLDEKVKISLSRTIIHQANSCSPRIDRLLRSTAPKSPVFSAAAALRMASGGGDDDERRSKDPNSNPRVIRLQELIGGGDAGGWEKAWEEDLTPWDLGQPTPVITHLLQSGSLPRGRILVPGCGGGHDVIAMAGPERFVVGLDISDSAISKAKELSASSLNASYVNFMVTDFFTFGPSELFDMVFDYTFFCAIEPNMRSAWAQKIKAILKPDGELLTLMYPLDDHVGGPPFSVSVADYEGVLNPLGFVATSVVDNELAIKQRKGLEKLGRWKLSHSSSSL